MAKRKTPSEARVDLLEKSPTVQAAAKQARKPVKEVAKGIEARERRNAAILSEPSEESIPVETPQPKPEPPSLPSHISVNQAAKRLGRSHSATYGLILKGALKSIRIGDSIRVVESSVNDIVNSANS